MKNEDFPSKKKPYPTDYSINSDSVDVYSNSYIFSDDNWYIDGIFGIGLSLRNRKRTTAK